MSACILWVEGVDFDETLFDTNDLSTVRGASLTLLAMPERIIALLRGEVGDDGVALVFSGASQAAFQLAGEEHVLRDAVTRVMATMRDDGRDPAQVQRDAKNAARMPGQLPATAPFAHLRFIWGLAPMAGEADSERAIQSAHAAARLMQLQDGASGGLLSGYARDVCQIDRHRPADASIWVKRDAAPADYAARGEDEADQLTRSQRIAVSSSVAARRHYGRWARQGFYAAELGLPASDARDLSFADSLHDIVADPPAGTPLALQQKLAIFYADGNKFGKIRAAISAQRGALNGLSTFSAELKRLQRGHLLAPLLSEFRGALTSADAQMLDRVALENIDRPALGRYLLRLETLLWGGDELTFVVPAWLGWWLARRFFALLSGPEWRIEGHELTFSAGLLFTSYKTPIREATALARDLADIGKATLDGAQRSILEVEALESVDPPVDGISAMRARLAGISERAGNAKASTIAADQLAPFTQKLAAYKRAETPESTVPRSQVYRILQEIDARSLKPGDAHAGEIAWTEYQQYASRTRRGVPPDELALLPELADKHNFALNFYLMAKLWDYIDPFGDEDAQADQAAEAAV